MAGRIVIDIEGCKGCGLCVSVCPKGCIDMSARTNRKGFPVAQANNACCIGCATCALMCPDVAIEVWREEQMELAAQPARTQKVRGTI